jgi:hemolysin activation/secretion protein
MTNNNRDSFATATPFAVLRPIASSLSTGLAALLAVAPAVAQTMPNAGQLLQQERTAPQLPQTAPVLRIQAPASLSLLPGGVTVTLQSVRFEGNTVFSAEQLSSTLGVVTGKSFDMAGLQALAQRLSEHYRAGGYPFARAYLPEQKFADGVLTLNVLEGRYGQVSTAGDAALAVPARRFLVHLEPGAVIETAALERATLVLNDLPGIKTVPLVRPGQELGAGDLVVEVSRTPEWRGDVGMDNYGNRSTGEYRLRLNLTVDGPFAFGDQLNLRSLVSHEGQWLGNLSYSLPIGGSGLRGNIGQAHTYYELGQQFASLGATGTADITTLGLSYPLIRSHQSNLSLTATYQHKQLEDKLGAVGTKSNKTSGVLPLTLQFDHRDTFAGGGISYGSLVFTAGNLDLDQAQKTVDITTAQTNGRFQKWSLDVARVQATPVPHLTLYGRVSAQWANKNLDSSEDFGLGGPSGVRAYPGGEGFGDEGWLTQFEARYQIGAFAPYAFTDAGRVTINHTPWSADTNFRELGGTGVGVRYNNGTWNVDASLAWRNLGDKPTSDTADRNPRAWVTLGWRF